MERYVVLIGEECRPEWSEDQRREWNRPIKEFFQYTYPHCDTSSLSWNGSGEDGGGYRISSDLTYCECVGPFTIKKQEHNYIILTRDQIKYSQNLQNILSE